MQRYYCKNNSPASATYGCSTEQQVDGVERPLAFFSRAMTTPEERYSTFDCELFSNLWPQTSLPVNQSIHLFTKRT